MGARILGVNHCKSSAVRRVAGQRRAGSADARTRRSPTCAGGTPRCARGLTSVADRQPADVLVIGAGIAGLACASALADRGMRVIVLERDTAAGGRARSWRHSAGIDVDIGPHVVHSEYGNFLAFLDRLGTRQRITWQPRKLMAIRDARGLQV